MRKKVCIYIGKTRLEGYIEIRPIVRSSSVKGEAMTSETSTKDKILSTALDLFSTKGVEGVSISDITGKVGIAKSSLYSHFKSKQAILDSILELYQSEINKISIDPNEYDRMVRTLSPEEFWNRILEKYLKTWSSEYLSRISRLIVLEQYKTETALALILEETRRILGLSEFIFGKMVEYGKIHPFGPADLARECAYALRGMLLEYDVLKAHGKSVKKIKASMRAFIHSFCKKIIPKNEGEKQ